MDDRNSRGAWTKQALRLIQDHPRRRAGDLAAMLGFDKLRFKQNVRKLKNMGLTISHEVGYELSPMGKVVLYQIDGKKL